MQSKSFLKATDSLGRPWPLLAAAASAISDSVFDNAFTFLYGIIRKVKKNKIYKLPQRPLSAGRRVMNRFTFHE